MGMPEGHDPSGASQLDGARAPARLPVIAVALLMSIAGLAFAASTFLGPAPRMRDERPSAVENGRIAMAHGRDQDIVLVHQTTGDVTLLVDRNGEEPNTNNLAMAWSPDGSMLAFTDVRPNGLNGLFVLDLATRDILDLTEDLNHADDPTWSTDGSRIAFGGADGRSGYEIYVAAPDGTNRTRVTDYPDDGASGAHMPAWSPDGGRIAFRFDRYDATTQTESHGVGIVSASGGNTITITEGLDELPAWSPDGTTVAFVRRNDDGTSSLRTVTADGREDHVVSRAGVTVAPIAAAKWSPDGTRILYSYRDLETSNLGLAIQDVQTSEEQVIVEDAFVGMPMWAPDGTRIALIRDDAGRPSPAASLWLIAPDGTDEIQVADGLEHVTDVAWQPSSTRTTLSPSTSPEPLPPADPQITSTIPLESEGGVSAILYAEGTVWVTAHGVEGGAGVDRSMLFRIDASTNEVAAALPLEGGPTFVSGGGGLIYGFGSVWVAGYGYVDGSSHTVLHRIDPRSNSVIASIPLHGTHGADVAVDESSVWVAYFGKERAGVSRVDPTTEQVVAEVALPSNYVRRITAAGGGVVATELEWSGNEGPCMVLTAIDPVTAVIMAREPVYPPCGGVQLFAWNDEIWASGAVLQKVDSTTARLLGHEIPFEEHRWPRSFVLGDGRALWFGAYPGGNGGRPDRVARLDTATGAIEYFIEAGGMDAVFAADTRTIWIMEYGGSVTRVDLHDR